MTTRMYGPPLALAALLILGACHGEQGAAPLSDVMIQDSAGVVVTRTPAALADVALGWSVGSTPDLVLGRADELDQDFHRITGVRQGPDGRVAVIDWGSSSVRFFDSTGALLETAGREGEGPGEYTLPVLIVAPASDSLMIWDSAQRRTTVLPSGHPSAFRVDPPGRWRTRPEGVADDGSALMRHGRTVVVPVPQGVHHDTVSYSWTHPTEGAGEPFVEIASASGYTHVDENDTRYLYRVPFRAPPAAAVRTSEAWITTGDAPELRAFDVTGRLVRIARVERDPVPVTEHMRGRYLAQYPDRAEIIDEMPRQETLPGFTEILVDDVGLLWAAWYGWDSAEPTTWTVFDPEGRALGTAETPADLDVMQIGADFVLGTTRTDLGVEQVWRYPLQRSPT